MFLLYVVVVVTTTNMKAFNKVNFLSLEKLNWSQINASMYVDLLFCSYTQSRNLGLTKSFFKTLLGLSPELPFTTNCNLRNAMFDRNEYVSKVMFGSVRCLFSVSVTYC